MNEALFLSIASTGFAVAFLHAAIPTHWLPFVLTARGQRWSATKTLWVTAFAGLGHVLFTSVLGVFVVWLGLELSQMVGSAYPYVAGGALIAFGVFYLVRFARVGGHDHGHGHSHGHGHEHADKKTRTTMSDRAAIMSLITLLTFSPCEGFLPVYLSGIGYGWMGFALLSAVLAGATLAGMVLFTWLTLRGLQHVRLGALERFEGAILGGLLCALGVMVVVLEQ